MLDLVARHGRMDLQVAVTGDLETGAHHTVEDTGLSLGQALDKALGDRSGIRRYGHAVVPMDEARASCAIDISVRPFVAVEPAVPHWPISVLDYTPARRFFRRVGKPSKLRP